MEINKFQCLSDLIGQDKIRESLTILVAAARQRGDALDHLLFIGSPGLGKTTFANMVAKEMRVNIKTVSGSDIERAGDLAAILTNLRAGDVLFIDEIHRLGRAIEEVFYAALEDFILDIVIGKGPSARSIRLKLPRFTLIGAATRLPKATEQLRSCMTLFQFAPYNIVELAKIILLQAEQQNIVIDINSVKLLARYCNGNAGEAISLLKKIHNYALVFNNGNITPEIVAVTMKAYNRENDNC